MNTIIVDSDCKLYFPQECLVKNVLKGSECKVYYLDSAESFKIESNCRCVLLSTMNNGMKKYHLDFMRANLHVKTWLISIVGTFFENEKNQLLENIDNTLSCCKVTYNVVFDNCLNLEKTNEICSMPIKENKTCLVVSKNSTIAKCFISILSSYLDKWDVIFGEQDLGHIYQSADLILAVGEKQEDYFLPAPKYHTGMTYAWVMCSESNSKQLRETVYNKLTEKGWNLCSIDNVYASTLELEEYLLKINNGDITCLELNTDENFVIWDKYGLPLKSEDYNTDIIISFLNRQCCFKDLIKRFG